VNKISPTMISTFNTCPYKFKILYVDKRLPLYKPEYEFGRKIHMIIAEYYKLLPDDAVPSDVPITLGQAIKRVFSNVDEYIVKYMRPFEEFEKQRLTWHINPKPILFEKEIVKGNIHGVVDAVFKRNNDVIVVDWKTGMIRDPTIDEHLKIQGNTYMYLLDAKEIYFLFIKYGVWHKLLYDEVYLKNKLEEFITAVKNNKYSRRNGPHCSRCEVNLHCYFDKYRLEWWRL